MATETLPQEPQELTREEFERLLEERVLRHLGMSLEEFIALLDRGELPDHPAATELAILVGARASTD